MKMLLVRIIGKFVLALVLTGSGIYLLMSADSSTNAQAAVPDYKVSWVATKFITLNFDKLFYPDGHNSNYNPDPLDHGAKTRLAIGVHEWNVIFKTKIDGCNTNTSNCYTDKYIETWRTGADLATNPLFATDNCYKVPANCQPGGKYQDQWLWGLGSENSMVGVVDVSTAPVTDTNLYATNSLIYDEIFSPCGVYNTCWQGVRGRGPGFLEVYRCNDTFGCKDSSGLALQAGSVYTSGAYSWQLAQSMNARQSERPGSQISGTLAPTKWYVTGTLYN